MVWLLTALLGGGLIQLKQMNIILLNRSEHERCLWNRDPFLCPSCLLLSLATLQVCTSKSFVLEIWYKFGSPVTEIQLLVKALLESISNLASIHHVWYKLASITNLTRLKSRIKFVRSSKHNIHINDHHWIFNTLCLNYMYTYFMCYDIQVYIYGGFLKWWYPTTIGFPTKNDHFGVWNGGTTILGNTHIHI